MFSANAGFVIHTVENTAAAAVSPKAVLYTVLNFLCGLLLRFYSADVPPCVHFPQREAAIYCDITEKAYQNYELMTREPKLEILVRIADLFEVSLDYLTGRTDCRPVKH